MNAKSFLKGIGLFAAKAASELTPLGPLIDLLVPADKRDKVAAALAHIQSELGAIGVAVMEIESLSSVLASPLPGAEKLRALAAKVRNIILASPLGAGDIIDTALFDAGCEKISQGAVDILNSRKHKDQ